MIHNILSEVTCNERIGEGCYLLGLRAPSIAVECSPGQFVLLRGLSREWPYLRRPFSVYSSDGESTIEIVYKAVGRATSLMAEMKGGEEMDLVGPLGEGFALAPGAKHAIALAGGIGIPPIGFYCQRYVDLLERITLVVGASTRRELLVPTGLVVQGVEILPYTEDGSKGSKGTVVDGLTHVLDRIGEPTDGVEAIACGPRDMLGKVARIAAAHSIPCQVSTEEVMACGVGACMSCALPAAGGGYLHVCKDGPVLDSTVIDWERWLAA
jgi:dihydroorotate dehydrogenase electron transfer subunit